MLPAYAQGDLPPESERRVAEHLAGCPACRAELEEIRFGIRMAGMIPQAPAPPALWASIQRALDAGEAPRAPAAGARPPWRWALVAAPIGILAAVLAWYAASRPQLRVREAAADPTGIERAALAEHERSAGGAGSWEIRTGDIPRIRRWVEETTGLSASIPADRPDEDAGRLRLVGARAGRVGTARAAVVGYEIDARPVTLVTAKLSDLADPPPEGRLSKNISFRSLSPAGRKILTWGSDGQAYAMVSDLPGYGQQGCFVCHTSPDRRSLIRSMRLRRDAR
jgi:anti-sigma factor RsiW